LETLETLEGQKMLVNAAKRKLAQMVFELMLTMLTADKLKEAMCWIISFLRQQVITSETKVDDKWVLPVLDAADEAFCQEELPTE
jgi:hypothetical protein